MEEKLEIVCFTAQGAALAEKLQTALGGSVQDGRAAGFDLRGWTGVAFSRSRALVFVGAVGIAVRAVAPWLRGKAEDPAVVCVDEQGRFAVALLSGHLGGANELAQRVAACCGGQAVISTATDLRGAFAVDLWARRQGLVLLQPERIKAVSARVLRGETLRVESPWPIAGTPPEGLVLEGPGDVALGFRPRQDMALQLAARCLTLGLGCRRGVTEAELAAAFADFCAAREILPEAICAAASIDRKADEAGLLAFCASRGWTLHVYTAKELAAVEGRFSASAFVQEQVGVDNVCERAAVLHGAGALIEPKFSQGGCTFALAMRAPELDWSW